MAISNSLQFGISTTVLREHPVTYALERIAAAGYVAAEVWPWHMERTGGQARAIASLARKLGLVLTVHAPTEGVNPASRDAEAARRARSQIAAALELAVELGARVFVVHPGRRDSDYDRAGDAWSRQMDWVVKLDELADSYGMPVGLELMEKQSLEIFTTPRDAARMMENPFKRLRLTVDLAHLNTHGDPAELLAALDPAWIAHVHLSDNAPWSVHLPLGEGRLDIGAALAALKGIYRGIVSLEGSLPGQGGMLLGRNMAFLSKLGYVPKK